MLLSSFTILSSLTLSLLHIVPLTIFRETFSEKLELTNLIIVACHGIWRGGPALGASDDEWILEPYQRGHNEALTWIAHIRAGVTLLQGSDNSVLVFSGGETRNAGGARAEGPSYWALADALGLLEGHSQYSTTENYARDSYENVLFSICRFREFTGRYPETIAVVGYAFKERRFAAVHRKALRLPAEKFSYIGIDPLHAPPGKVDEMRGFEKGLSLAPFETDPYACFDRALREKRFGRNPGRRRSSYQ